MSSHCGAHVDGSYYQRLVRDVHGRYKDLIEGANADYIPELAGVPDQFAVAIATREGELYWHGDADSVFAIESLSKVFTLALVLQQRGGAQEIIARIGVEPNGFPFNSILATQALEAAGVNPLLNAGALATVSLVESAGCATSDSEASAAARFATILDWYEKFSGNRLQVLQKIYASEAATNARNRAIAYILAGENRIWCDPMEATEVYTRQCSLGITTRQLAVMGATLANGGVNPLTGLAALEARHTASVLAIMTMAGLYTESGTWALNTGVPAKSGVGGGLLAVVPGRLAIAAFSPRLNKAGNSIRAMRAISDIAAALGANIFATENVSAGRTAVLSGRAATV